MENFFKYFTTIYFETTDPSKTIQDLLKNPGIYVSSLFHSILYAGIFVFLKSYFSPKHKEYDVNLFLKLSKFLFFLMLIGYIARFYRMKAIVAEAPLQYFILRDTAYFRFYFFG